MIYQCYRCSTTQTFHELRPVPWCDGVKKETSLKLMKRCKNCKCNVFLVEPSVDKSCTPDNL